VSIIGMYEQSVYYYHYFISIFSISMFSLLLTTIILGVK